MHGYGYKPNKFKADNDRSFQMKIVGVSRSDWQSVIRALEEWQQLKGGNADAQQLGAVERGAGCMHNLIAGGSDGLELREYTAAEAITRKPTRAELKIIRQLQKSTTGDESQVKPKQGRRKGKDNAKTLAE